MELRTLDARLNNQDYTGHLVRKVRKSMGLKQYEIVNDQITRNLISLVENNKIPLTANSASIIVACINEHAKSIGSHIRITEQDLRVDGIYEARLKIDGYLETFDNIDNEGKATIDFMFHDINVLFSQFDLPDAKANLYNRMALYFDKKSDLSQAIFYYLKALDAKTRVSSVEDVLLILSDLIRCYLRTADYANVVRHAKIAENLAPLTEYKAFQAILFNKAIAFRRSKDFKRCLWEIERMLKLWPDLMESRQFDLKLLKASVLRATNAQEEAIAAYLDLYFCTEQKLNRALLLSGLVSLFVELKDNHRITQPLNELVTLLEPLDAHPEHLCRILADLSLAYHYLGDTDLAKPNFKRAMKLALTHNQREVLYSIVDTLTSNTAAPGLFYPMETDALLIELFKATSLPLSQERMRSLVRFYMKHEMHEALEGLFKVMENPEGLTEH